jgi:hypothetical protein
LASKVIIFSIKILDQFIIWINPDQNKSQPERSSSNRLLSSQRIRQAIYEKYLSWSRWRIACRALFLSCITTPDGKQIDAKYLSPRIMSDPPMSAYHFATEMPCPKDWQVWIEFWEEVTFPGFVLVTSLGTWIHKSHRPNEWFYNSAADSLFQQTPGGGNFYVRTESDLRALLHSNSLRKQGPLVPKTSANWALPEVALR